LKHLDVVVHGTNPPLSNLTLLIQLILAFVDVAYKIVASKTATYVVGP